MGWAWPWAIHSEEWDVNRLWAKKGAAGDVGKGAYEGIDPAKELPNGGKPNFRQGYSLF